MGRQVPLADYELGWLVGYLDGEACFQHRIVDGRPYVRIEVNTTDIDPVIYLHALVGGVINGPYPNISRGKRVKDQWQISECLTTLREGT